MHDTFQHSFYAFTHNDNDNNDNKGYNICIFYNWLCSSLQMTPGLHYIHKIYMYVIFCRFFYSPIVNRACPTNIFWLLLIL